MFYLLYRTENDDSKILKWLEKLNPIQLNYIIELNGTDGSLFKSRPNYELWLEFLFNRNIFQYFAIKDLMMDYKETHHNAVESSVSCNSLRYEKHSNEAIERTNRRNELYKKTLDKYKKSYL